MQPEASVKPCLSKIFWAELREFGGQRAGRCPRREPGRSAWHGV